MSCQASRRALAASSADVTISPAHRRRNRTATAGDDSGMSLSQQQPPTAPRYSPIPPGRASSPPRLALGTGSPVWENTWQRRWAARVGVVVAPRPRCRLVGAAPIATKLANIQRLFDGVDFE